jgi:hypothetical protein
MKRTYERMPRVLGLGIALAVLAGGASAAGLAVKPLAAGLSFDSFTRTVVWKGDETDSRLAASLLTARAELGLGRRGVVLGLFAGLAFSDASGLVFGHLPISLRYDGSAVAGLSVGADILAPIAKLGEFEINGAGRIVYTSGMSKTWPLEGFAVEGEAKGKPGWLEASVGPRVEYLEFGKVVPYVELSARWLTASFRMDETLGELEGSETKKVGGDIAFGAALGADAEVSRRVALRGKIGILPFPGGVDTVATVGVLYRF